jgi:2-polyprenyl-3-methyl-5-hydroxy-6-metoxy-1,4-benzoquinol methylase
MSSMDSLEEWPEAELEKLNSCPVCHASNYSLLHDQVRDWSFFSAPGAWSYWHCNDCASVFLNPRPSEQSIGRAYKTYYTHKVSAGSGVARAKTRWKNEKLSQLLNRDIRPRLNLPVILKPWLARRAARMGLPFGWAELGAMNPGELMDVGCGSGLTLSLAQQMGWRVRGLELDAQAVNAARQGGLDVQQGGFERLSEFSGAFDAIVCAHVIEHVFDPARMIELLHSALRPGGVLLLSTPNAQSDVHVVFGKHWRGLEAPRHLILFTQSTLLNLLTRAGFNVTLRSDAVLRTARESLRIARQGDRINAFDRANARHLSRELVRTPNGQDFIQVVAIRRNVDSQ